MASVRDNLDADFMDTLRSNFPIAVSLPDFYRRSSQEKIEMILDLVTRRPTPSTRISGWINRC